MMAYMKMPLRKVKPDLKENQVKFFVTEIGKILLTFLSNILYHS